MRTDFSQVSVVTFGKVTGGEWLSAEGDKCRKARGCKREIERDIETD